MSKKLITLDDLDELHMNKIKYFKDELKNKSLPAPLFCSDGNYNESNWNSGESTYIREFINVARYDRVKAKHYDFDVMYWEADINVYGELFITCDYIDDFTYLFITVDGKTYIADTDRESNFINQYMVKIYKNRGNIHTFTHNGKPIKRNNYLSLLHILQSAKLIKGV